MTMQISLNGNPHDEVDIEPTVDCIDNVGVICKL